MRVRNGKTKTLKTKLTRSEANNLSARATRDVSWDRKLGEPKWFGLLLCWPAPVFVFVGRAKAGQSGWTKNTPSMETKRIQVNTAKR